MPAGGPWSAVLFDLDGTLADTVGLILDCYRYTMRSHLGAPRPDQEWLDTLGAPLRSQLTAFARSDEEAEAMFETYVAYQHTIHDERVRGYPGAADLLVALRAGGVALGIVTGKRRQLALRTLSCSGLADLYDHLVAGDDVSPGKPDPAPVRASLEGLGHPPPERTILVGDSPLDIAAGRGAGVVTAAVLWGPFDYGTLAAARPDHFVPDIPSLRSLLLDGS